LFTHDLKHINFFSLLSDELEVESLFERELAKMYDPNNPEDDMVEKVRMHSFSGMEGREGSPTFTFE
jgi:hypothetical protein